MVVTVGLKAREGSPYLETGSVKMTFQVLSSVWSPERVPGVRLDDRAEAVEMVGMPFLAIHVETVYAAGALEGGWLLQQEKKLYADLYDWVQEIGRGMNPLGVAGQSEALVHDPEAVWRVDKKLP